MTIDIPWHIQRAGPAAVSLYTSVIERDGPQAWKWAEMVSLRQPPGIKGTNDQFQRGLKHGAQFNPDKPTDRMFLQMCKDKARQAGVSIEGKVYYTDAAEYPGDPRAWFASRDDLKAYIRSRGWSCEALGIKGPEVEVENTPYCVSDEIVEEEIEKLREEHPEAGATPRELADLKEQLREKLSGRMYGKR